MPTRSRPAAQDNTVIPPAARPAAAGPRNKAVVAIPAQASLTVRVVANRRSRPAGSRRSRTSLTSSSNSCGAETLLFAAQLQRARCEIAAARANIRL